jgi:tRNA1(Val) A37 N6-methylase TrmN6
MIHPFLLRDSKMRSSFSLFQSHLDVAHHYWSQIVQPGDYVIDATCGNGQDTLKLCRLALSSDKGKVYAFDIQCQAIEATRHHLASHLPPSLYARVELEQRCHSSFPNALKPNSVKLIVYNLGYLPGGDKTRTTQVRTTLQSLRAAQQLIQPGGAISLTCYPGHPEGAQEQEHLLNEMKSLCPKEWSCCHHTWLNRQKSPTLLLIQKSQDHPIPTTVR